MSVNIDVCRNPVCRCGRRASTGISAGDAAAYTVVQVAGGVAGAWLANLMFDRQVFEIAATHRGIWSGTWWPPPG